MSIDSEVIIWGWIIESGVRKNMQDSDYVSHSVVDAT